MVVLRAVEWLAGVDERVHFNTYPVDVEAGDVEDLELGHDGFGGCQDGHCGRVGLGVSVL